MLERYRHLYRNNIYSVLSSQIVELLYEVDQQNIVYLGRKNAYFGITARFRNVFPTNLYRFQK